MPPKAKNCPGQMVQGSKKAESRAPPQEDAGGKKALEVRKHTRAAVWRGKTCGQVLRIPIFFHPDCTVGFGVSPNHALRLVGYTTGREFHPALKIYPILRGKVYAPARGLSSIKIPTICMTPLVLLSRQVSMLSRLK